MATRTKKGRVAGSDVAAVADEAAPVRMATGERKRTRPVHAMRVPIGIEKVLYLAASRPDFRARLLEDRERTIAAAKVRLSDVERSTLLGVPRPALEAMIARISPAKHGKRKFMKTVAAASVSLAAGVLGAGCGEDDTVTGIRPDVPDEDVTEVDGSEFASEGIRPDATEDVTEPDVADDGADVEVRDVYADAGVGPDGEE